MQKLVDVLGEAARQERSHYHLTLGAAIKTLEGLPPDTLIEFEGGGSPDHPHSYRGYYSDLAFEATSEPLSAADFLKLCRSALGNTFGGYKGGDFTMSENTPLWRASYGDCGPAIMGLQAIAGKGILSTKHVD